MLKKSYIPLSIPAEFDKRSSILVLEYNTVHEVLTYLSSLEKITVYYLANTYFEK